MSKTLTLLHLHFLKMTEISTSFFQQKSKSSSRRSSCESLEENGPLEKATVDAKVCQLQLQSLSK